MSNNSLNPFEKWEPFAELTEEKIELSIKRICSQINLLSAALAKSGPLDFPLEKSFFLLTHEKSLGHMFQK